MVAEAVMVVVHDVVVVEVILEVMAVVLKAGKLDSHSSRLSMVVAGVKTSVFLLVADVY